MILKLKKKNIISLKFKENYVKTIKGCVMNQCFYTVADSSILINKLFRKIGSSFFDYFLTQVSLFNKLYFRCKTKIKNKKLKSSSNEIKFYKMVNRFQWEKSDYIFLQKNKEYFHSRNFSTGISNFLGLYDIILLSVQKIRKAIKGENNLGFKNSSLFSEPKSILFLLSKIHKISTWKDLQISNFQETRKKSYITKIIEIGKICSI